MDRQHSYRSQVLDHLGLVAGMFDELGIGEVIDQATQQNPEMRLVTAGHAVKAMVLNGLGFVNQQLDLVPRFFAELFLRKELGLTQDEARQIVSDRTGKCWRLERFPGGRGKGTPQALLPITEEDSLNSLDRETENQRSLPDEPSEGYYSVPQAGSGSQSNPSINPHQDGSPEVPLLCPDRQKSSNNQTKGAKGKTSDTVLPNQLPLLEEAS
jgi:hypothetical protein